MKNKFLNKLKIVSYLRELSIVIIGILITLLITNTFTNYNRQKELRGMLELVKEELQDNIKNLNTIHKKWEGEINAFRLLKENLNNVASIPIDSLEKYQYAVTTLHYFNPKKDAYEVLKNSIYVQYIKEKSLMPHLSYIYDQLNTIQGQLTRYSEQKTTLLSPLLYDMEVEEIEVWLNGDIYDYFCFPIQEKGFRTFLIIGETILAPGIFESSNQAIQEILKEMEQYGY